MVKKDYFRERTVSQIRSMQVKPSGNSRHLVELIDDLDPARDALQIMTYLIPARTRRGNLVREENMLDSIEYVPTNKKGVYREKLTGAQASRRYFHHGDLLALSQERGYNATLGLRDRPLDLRVSAFRQLGKKPQEEINFIGYSWFPVFGEKTKRVVPFVWLPEAARIFTYAENFTRFVQINRATGEKENKTGIKVREFANSRRVLKEGASVVVEVPSRSEKKLHYIFGLRQVPFIPNRPGEENNNLASVLGLRHFSIHGEDYEIINGHTPQDIFDIRYTFENSRQGSDLVKFSPQDIAGYMGVIKKQLSEQGNPTALTFNPFAFPSRHQADFYLKLCNNVLIFDPTLNGWKGDVRKLHLAEKSILLARAIGHFGHNDFSFWDPTRDGSFKDYDWSVKLG